MQLQAAITPQRLQVAGNSLPNWPSTGCVVTIFIVRTYSKSFTSNVRSVQERYLPKFSATLDVRYCALKPIRRSAGAAWRLIYGKSRLNWKLKISNVADNVDITQSQARDIRHRRMQDVNSLWTDNWPFRANTVLCLFNTIQPSNCIWVAVPARLLLPPRSRDTSPHLLGNIDLCGKREWVLTLIHSSWWL